MGCVLLLWWQAALSCSFSCQWRTQHNQLAPQAHSLVKAGSTQGGSFAISDTSLSELELQDDRILKTNTTAAVKAASQLAVAATTAEMAGMSRCSCMSGLEREESS